MGGSGAWRGWGSRDGGVVLLMVAVVVGVVGGIGKSTIGVKLPMPRV